jgi:hypothetical protein
LIETLDQFGSGLLASLIRPALFFFAAWAAYKIGSLLGGARHAEDTYAPYDPWKERRGCLFQILLFLALLTGLLILFDGGITALQRHACKGSEDFQNCMDPEPREDWM